MGEPVFNRKKRYVNKEGHKYGQGVWLTSSGGVLKPGQGFLTKDGKVIQYNTDGTKTTFTRSQWQDKKTREHELQVLQNDRKYGIPFIPSKKVTLTIGKNSPTRKNAGATFSENLLDSIAVNASKARIPFGTALGIVAQESTFGHNSERGIGKSLEPWLYVLNKGKDTYKKTADNISYQNIQSPSLLTSNWKRIFESPFSAYQYNSQGYLRNTPQNNEYYDADFGYSLRKSNNYQVKDVSPLFHSFREYKKNPNGYNPGDPDYPNKVEAQKNELINYSPEIKAYMKKHNLHADGGRIDDTIHGTIIPLGRIHIDENGNMVDLLDGKEYITSATNGRDVVITGIADHWKEAGKRNVSAYSPYSSISQVAKDIAYNKLDNWVDKNMLEPNDYDINKIRRNLYNKLDPWGYDKKDDFGNVIISPDQKIKAALDDKTPNRDFRMNDDVVKRNPIYAKYLGLDTYYNGYNMVNTDDNLEISDYSPTIGNQGNTYYKSPTESDDVHGPFSDLNLVKAFKTRDTTGKNTFVNSRYDGVMGHYTISFGKDKKGKYISYYDIWDLNPFEGTVIEDGDIGERYGIGKPVHLYNRKYYTDEDSTRIVNKYKRLNSFGDGGYLNNDWDSLSYRDKAEMMKVAITNGITALPEIKNAYNEFAKGGRMNWTMEDEAGYRYWRSKLPRNLRETNDNDYDMRAAYKAGMEPQWNNEDKTYHLGSRDPQSGRILKAAHHPTFLKALLTDASMGYYPTTDNNGNTYTETWKGNSYGGGGYMPSSTLKKSIANWEGASMKTNRSFEAEARDFNRVIPSEIRSKLSSNQLDALYSYGYNVGMGKLKERVLPTLTAYTQGKATKEDVQRSMWATKDSQLRGLTRRRNWEREMFGGNYRTTFDDKNIGVHIDPTSFQLPQSFFNDTNAIINTEIPQMQMPNEIGIDPSTLYKAPVIDNTLFANPEKNEEVVYSPKEDRMEGVKRFNTIMGIMGRNTPLDIFGESDEPGIMQYVNAIYS